MTETETQTQQKEIDINFNPEKYEVLGLDENFNVVRSIIHETGQYNNGDICKDIEGDFYLRYICPLDAETEKRSSTAIVLKKPIQNMKYIICNDKYERK